jgi:hypothetical protein
MFLGLYWGSTLWLWEHVAESINIMVEQRKRERKGPVPEITFKVSTPSYLLCIARLHLLKFPPAPQTAFSAGDQLFITWACGNISYSYCNTLTLDPKNSWPLHNARCHLQHAQILKNSNTVSKSKSKDSSESLGKLLVVSKNQNKSYILPR